MSPHACPHPVPSPSARLVRAGAPVGGHSGAIWLRYSIGSNGRLCAHMCCGFYCKLYGHHYPCTLWAAPLKCAPTGRFTDSWPGRTGRENLPSVHFWPPPEHAPRKAFEAGPCSLRVGLDAILFLELYFTQAAAVSGLAPFCPCGGWSRNRQRASRQSLRGYPRLPTASTPHPLASCAFEGIACRCRLVSHFWGNAACIRGRPGRGGTQAGGAPPKGSGAGWRAEHHGQNASWRAGRRPGP